MPSSSAKSQILPVTYSRHTRQNQFRVSCRFHAAVCPRSAHLGSMMHGMRINAAESMPQVRIAPDNTNLYRSSNDINVIEGADRKYMSQ